MASNYFVLVMLSCAAGWCQCTRGAVGEQGAPGQTGPRGFRGEQGLRGQKGEEGSFDFMLAMFKGIIFLHR